MSSTTLGIDRFLQSKPDKDTKIGLVTNATGITADGVPSWKALLQAECSVAALFGPEHGFRGEAQDAVEVADEEFSGIPVYSLFGARVKPTREMLEPLDVVVYDIQDVGARYYTYLYTLAYTMEACQEFATPLVVLDRPNPIGAEIVQGNRIPSEYDSFVGGYGLSPRYGMTVGEFAHYLKGEYFPSVELTVVWMEGYERTMFFEETGLPWPLPSPNLPTVDTALLYPGTCLIEGTTLSEGRGTTRPFEVVGAPWLDGEKLRESLAAYELSGVRVSSIFFTPTISKHKDTLCQGVLIHLVDPNSVDSLRVGLTVLHEAARLSGASFAWRELWEGDGFFFDRLAGGPELRHMVERGADADDLYGAATAKQSEFETVRSRYLHY